MSALRVLCLDHEGGHGGASRSLFHVLAHMDRAAIAPEAWCRRGGEIERLYAGIGVPCRIEPGLPARSSQPRTFDNIVEYGRLFRAWGASAPAREALRGAASGFDAVHVNHESLWWLARWLRPRFSGALVMHVRTRPTPTPFARWQARTMRQIADALVFITENEREHFARLAGSAPGKVIYNAAEVDGAAATAHPAVPADGRLKVASLSNYAWVRGVDRLVDVASELAARGRRDVLFVLAGGMTLAGRPTGRLGELATQGGSLADWAAERGVADMFLFLGHVPDPERVLAACDVLAKLSREDAPWGRDVIEAMAQGRAVLATGSWEGYVANGATGVLQTPFDAAAAAQTLIGLAEDRARTRAMGEAGRARIRKLCDGPARASDLAATWREAAARRRAA
jgi:glycosyltransferase involved in cell wall biosynthesis